MKAEKSYPPSARWRPRKANGVNFSPCPRSTDSVSPSSRAEHWCLRSCSQAERVKQLSSAFLFYSGPQWIRWCSPTLGRAVNFTEYTDANTNPTQKHSGRNTQGLGAQSVGTWNEPSHWASFHIRPLECTARECACGIWSPVYFLCMSSLRTTGAKWSFRCLTNGFCACPVTLNLGCEDHRMTFQLFPRRLYYLLIAKHRQDRGFHDDEGL